MLRVENLSKHYAGLATLHNISFSIERREKVALIECKPYDKHIGYLFSPSLLDFLAPDDQVYIFREIRFNGTKLDFWSLLF